MDREINNFEEENLRLSIHIWSRDSFPRQSWVEIVSFVFRHLDNNTSHISIRHCCTIPHGFVGQDFSY